MFNLEFKQISRVFRSWTSIPEWLRNLIPIGKQVTMLRAVLGMNQTQLAQRTKTAQRSIVRLEKEEVDPQLSTLNKVAEALHCHLLIRFIPKEDLEKFLTKKAREKASQLISLSAASANIELQKPSPHTIREEVDRLAEQIFRTKRSSIWEE